MATCQVGVLVERRRRGNPRRDWLRLHGRESTSWSWRRKLYVGRGGGDYSDGRKKVGTQPSNVRPGLLGAEYREPETLPLDRHCGGHFPQSFGS